MSEAPANLDNCLRFCPNLHRGAAYVTEIATEHACSGPHVSRHIVDIRDYGVEEVQTTVDRGVSCPAIYEMHGIPIEAEERALMDAAPIIVSEVVTQEELRRWE